MGGPPCVPSPSAVPMAGQGDRALSQPCSDLKVRYLCWLLGPSMGRSEVEGSTPQTLRHRGPHSTFAGGGGIPGWEPSVAGRGALHCN